MNQLLRDVTARRDGVFLRREFHRAGYDDADLRRLLRVGVVRRLLHGVYAEGDNHDPWVLHRAALALAPRGSALADLSAAAALAPILDIPDVPRVLVPIGSTHRPEGVAVRRARLPERHVVEVRGLRVTAGPRTAADVARIGRRVESLVAVDAVLHSTGSSIQSALQALTDSGSRRHRRTGTCRLLDAEPRSESPGETRLRLVLVDGGLPRPEAQVPVRDDLGGWLARADLGWPEAQLAAEYLGAVHLRDEAPLKDRRRRNTIGLAAAAWQVLEYGDREVSHQHAVIVSEVRQALGSRCPRLLVR
jgi:hypothetical protein